MKRDQKSVGTKVEGNIQATQDEGNPSSIYPPTTCLMVHHQPAPIPCEEGPDGKREAGEPNSETLRDALLYPQLDRLVQDRRVLLDDPLLGCERVDGLDRAQGLLDQGIRLGVLMARLAGEVEKVLAVDQPRDYEKQDQRKRDQSQPPAEISGEGQSRDEDGRVHQK